MKLFFGCVISNIYLTSREGEHIFLYLLFQYFLLEISLCLLSIFCWIAFLIKWLEFFTHFRYTLTSSTDYTHLFLVHGLLFSIVLMLSFVMLELKIFVH
jgi:hypothetical protein